MSRGWRERRSRYARAWRESLGLERTLQGLAQPLEVGSIPGKRDAQRRLEPPAVGEVAHQHAAGGEARADRAGTRSAFDEHEVRLRRPGREAGGGQPRAEEATLLADPSHMDTQRLGAAPQLGEGERNRWRRHG